MPISPGRSQFQDKTQKKMDLKNFEYLHEIERQFYVSYLNK